MTGKRPRRRQNVIWLVPVCLIAVLLWGEGLLLRAEAQQAEPAGSSLSYKPPQRGAPGGRTGGGTRGLADTTLGLAVLAPKEHTGLTVNAQPALYWYLGQETKHPVHVTLTDRQSVKPLLEVRLVPPIQAGIQQVRLADHNIRLQPGVPYDWSVAIVPDATQRSQDIIVMGTIELVAPPDGLQGQLTKAGKTDAPRLYAKAGLWYDAIAALSALIATAPQDMTLRQQRAALLEQEGLPEAAAYDRQRK
jgi:hypothetical protein